MQNKGYTLVEMLVVLSILSMLTLLFAFSYRSLKENTTYWNQSIYERLLQAQTTAMTQKRRVFVDFQGNRMSIDGASLKLSTDCGYHQFHFNTFGNPSKALSITCAIGSEQRVIVVELGSGRLYVR